MASGLLGQACSWGQGWEDTCLTASSRAVTEVIWHLHSFSWLMPRLVMMSHGLRDCETHTHLLTWPLRKLRVWALETDELGLILTLPLLVE